MVLKKTHQTLYFVFSLGTADLKKHVSIYTLKIRKIPNVHGLIPK